MQVVTFQDSNSPITFQGGTPMPTIQGGVGQPFPDGHWLHESGYGQTDPRAGANTLRATIPILLVAASVIGILWYGRRFG